MKASGIIALMLLASGGGCNADMLNSTGEGEVTAVFDTDDQTGGISGGSIAAPTSIPNALNRNRQVIQVTLPLSKPPVRAVSTLPRLCGCAEPNTNTSDIRAISNQWCSGGGAPGNSFGLSNMVWAWGQLLDHELVGTIDDTDGPEFTIDLENERTMMLRKVRALNLRCPQPLNVHTGTIDGTAVYSALPGFERTLRELRPVTCRLREGEPGFLPLTTSADEEGRFFIVAGDGRVDEHAVLTTMHTLLFREHNRLCDVIAEDPRMSRMHPNVQYRIAKSTVIAKMQQITVNGFLPALGITLADLQGAARENLGTTRFSRKLTFLDSLRARLAARRAAGSNRPSPNRPSPERVQQPAIRDRTNRISAEFSVAYRLGHTLIPDTIGDFNLADLFDGQKFFLFNEEGGVGYKPDAGALMDRILGLLSTTPASEMDGKMGDALRNILFGPEFQEDLCSRNIFRSREMNIPSYANIATCFGQTPDPTVEAETPDMFLGLLREQRPAGQPLGPTHKAILVDQFSRSLFSRSGSWWRTDRRLTPFTRFFTEEIESTTMEKLITDNSGAVVTTNAFTSDGQLAFQEFTPDDPPPTSAPIFEETAVADATIVAMGPETATEEIAVAPVIEEVPVQDPIATAEAPANCNTVLTGIDVPGSDIAAVGNTASIEACISACQNQPGCNAISRLNSNGACFMKTIDVNSFETLSVDAFTSYVICDAPATDVEDVVVVDATDAEAAVPGPF